MQYLTLHAERLADKPAVIGDQPGGSVTRWTFAELNRQVNRLANVFLDLGVKPGDKVVWCPSGRDRGGA